MSGKIKFVKDKKRSQLLNTLGIPYGLVLGFKTGEAWLVRSLEAGNVALNDMLKQKLITEEASQGLLKEMLLAGIETTENVIYKILQFPIPNDFPPSYNFDICAEPNCPRPLVHGHICDKNGKNITKNAVAVLTDGLEICEELAQLGGQNTLEAIRLFQHMSGADMPASKADWYQRYKTLPEETRFKYEDAKGRAAVKEIYDRLHHLEKDHTIN